MAAASMELPPTIAIHGVGTHQRGDISRRVGAAFRHAGLSSRIDEFNWDDFIGHSVEKVGDGIALLNQMAESISRTASLRLPATASTIDRSLQQIGDALYHWLFRVLIAAILTLLTIGPFVHLLMLLPTAAFKGISWPDLLWLVTATRIGIAAAAAVFTCMLLVDVIRSAARLSLAPVWVTIRRGGLLALQPLILLLTIPVSVRFGSGLVKGIVGFIPMLMVSGLLNIVLSPLSGQFTFMITSLAGMAALLAAAAVLGALHIIARRLWVEGPLKVILDIVRYMGSPTYRTTLQEAFDDRITRLEAEPSGERRVLLLAHSLGSVIAIDSLINSKEWRPTDRVYLVTLGSPIRRSFIRFFPGYLFPTSVDASARIVASRVAYFSWINVHRRWDYVGTGLGLDREGLGQDLSTGQITSVMSSHSDYWDDEVVIGTIKSALERSRPVVTQPVTTAAPALPDVEEPEYLMTVTRLARALAIMLIVGMVGLAAVSFTRAWRTSVDDIKRGVADVAHTGTKALADVTYHRTLVGAGEDSFYQHHFVFTVADLPAPLPQIDIDDRTVDYRFDYERLAAFVLEQCGRADEKRWWQIFRSVTEIPCTRAAIPLLYDAGKPGSFWLPQFPPRRTTAWDTVQ
jgi:hypothetical protein